MALKLYVAEVIWQQGDRSWTEKYARLKEQPKDAAQMNNELLNKMLEVRHTSCNLYAVRASNPLLPFDEYSRVFNLPGRRVGGADDEQDLVQAAALIRTISSNNHKGSMYLRGLADRDVRKRSGNNASFPSDYLARRITDMEDILKQDASYGMEVPTPTTAAGFAWVTIDQIIPHPSNPVLSIIKTSAPIANITVPPADQAPPGILVRGVDQKKLPALKGMFRVIAVSADKKEFTVQYTWQSNLQSYNPPQGFARPWYPQFAAFSEFVFQRFTTRDTGGPIIRSRGRRGKAVSRR